MSTQEKETITSITDQEQSLQNLVKEIATYLPGWQYVTPQDSETWYAWIHGERGERLFIRTYYNDGKLSVSGKMPPKDWRNQPFEIKVSMARGAYTIAKEITRRLLPAYLKEYQQAYKRVQQSEACEAAQRLSLSQLAETMGETIREGKIYFYVERPPTKTGKDWADIFSADIHVDSDQTIKIERLHVPFEVGQAICQILADFKAGKF